MADDVNILDQDTWPLATGDQVQYLNDYLVIDLSKQLVVTLPINKKARQGENGVILKFWLKDGLIPHQLATTDSALLMAKTNYDQANIRVAQADLSMDEATAGRITFVCPYEFFTTAGTYKRMLLQINKGDQILASINLRMDVLPNDFVTITANSIDFATPVIDKLNDALAQIDTSVSSWKDKFQNLLDKYQNAVDAVNIMKQSITDNAVPTLPGDNTFTGTNTFSKAVSALANLNVAGNLSTSGAVSGTDFITSNGKLSDVLDRKLLWSGNVNAVGSVMTLNDSIANYQSFIIVTTMSGSTKAVQYYPNSGGTLVITDTNPSDDYGSAYFGQCNLDKSSATAFNLSLNFSYTILGAQDISTTASLKTFPNPLTISKIIGVKGALY